MISSNKSNEKNLVEASAIERVIKFIDKQLENPTEKLDKGLLGVLVKVKEYLERSKNGEQMDEVAHALWCLEHVFLRQYNFVFHDSSRKFTSELQSKKQYRPLPEWWNQKSVDSDMVDVSDSSHEMLGKIYVTLVGSYKPGWFCEYIAKDPKQGIMFDVIGEWQNNMMQLSSSKDRALRDMGTRGINVRLESEVNKQEGAVNTSNTLSSHADSIHKLVESATAYSQTEKELLEPWLKANGSQDNQNIVPLLVIAGEFKFSNAKKSNQIDDELNIGPTSGSGEWFKDKDGSICFEFTRNVYSFTKMGGMYNILCDEKEPGLDKTVELKNNDPRMPNSNEEICKRPPLLEFKGKIKLIIDEAMVNGTKQKIVKPIFTVLTVKSNTDYVEVPARFQNLNQQLKIENK